jgi:hypothetical protein
LCQILSSATAIFFIGESLWLRNANLTMPLAPFLKDKKEQGCEAIGLNSSSQLTKIQRSLSPKFYYQEVKLSVSQKTKLYWETINYTVPLDYHK